MLEKRRPPPDERLDLAVGVAIAAAHAGVRLTRLALFPLRVAAKLPVVDSAVFHAEARLETTGRLALDRVRRQLEDRGDLLEAAVERALADERVHRVTLTAVESKLAGEVTDRVLANPEVQSALTRQTTTFAGETIAAVRTRAAAFDDVLARRPSAPGFSGLTMRGIAFFVDVAIVELVVLGGAALLAFVAAAVGGLRPAWLVAVLAAVGATVVLGGYMAGFWWIAGQTPGMRLMGLRVVDVGGRSPGLGRSLLRVVALGVAIVPFFAGLLPVLFDRRRRGLQDYVARTTVVRDD
jgi:uncharacterized RDD family membrane protein YckC